MPSILPSPPEALLAVVRLAGDESASAAQLTRCIERDAAFTVSLLKLANSAAYGVGRPIQSVGQAAALLGTRCIRGMALSHAVRAATATVDVGGFDLAAFWEASLRRGVAARAIAERAGCEAPTEAFTLGLIQDIGLVEMAARRKDCAAAVEESTRLPDPECLDAERRATGTTHPEVFATTAREWGLPEDIVTVIAEHHSAGSPEDAAGDRRVRRLVEICHAADLVARLVQTEAGGGSRERAEAVVGNLRSRAPLAVEALLDTIGTEVVRDAADLGIRVGPQPSLSELLATASRSLAQLNLGYEQLTRQLRQALAEKEQLAAELAAANASLRRLAATDPLTGLANRRAFMGALEAAVLATAAGGAAVSLVLLDVDHFKQVNDTYGHSVGDEILRAISRRLEAGVRTGDLVGRVGGEEFAVLLPGCPAAEGVRVAERLRRALRAEPIATREGALVAVTSSFGGATLDGGRTIEPDDFLRRSDRALYASKGAGRDRVTWS